MSVGITVKDDIRVGLGESMDSTIEKLKLTELRYSIPFDKVSRQSGIHETLISVDDMGIEISLENGIVTFLKSIPNEETIVMNIDDAIKLRLPEYLDEVKEFIRKRVGAELISIDNFDAKSYNTVISFKESSKRIRATILKSNRGELFLNTIRQI
ncbi:MAG: hypothetical protein J6A59_03140 [Lachnospiraceae bacterium]|nr:hypothetical protein [Lachnospiraceae bacterium]